jgi:cysteine desulfurase
VSSTSANGRVYLDYAGFAPIDARVLGVMRPFLEGGVGNASSMHALGGEARDALAGARLKVTRLFGGAPDGTVFTSGATEANNLALRGVAERARGRHVVVSAVEHVSVMNCCRDLVKRGFEVTHVGVDGDGRLDAAAVERALRADTALVSIGAANGETGALAPIDEIGRRVHARGVPFHVDGVNALGRVPVDVEASRIDLLTIASNDLHGPPGVGALWVRPGVTLAPILLGGGQEHGYRAGTENLPAIVGFGVAAELARTERATEAARVAALRDRLLEGVLERVPAARITGPRGAERVPHHASFIVPGAKADAVLTELDLRGIAASSGSACNALTGQPSHVLLAIGASPADAEGSLCFTLGRWTTEADIDRVVDVLPRVIARLRSLAGV